MSYTLIVSIKTEMRLSYEKKTVFPDGVRAGGGSCRNLLCVPGLLPLAEPVSVHAAAEDGAVKIPSPDKTDRRVFVVSGF